MKVVKLGIVVITLISTLWVTACQNCPRQTTMCHIKEELEQSTCQDKKVELGGMRFVPDEVCQAMAPSNMLICCAKGPQLEKCFDIYADQVPAKSFFMGLAKDTSYNITVHPQVTGNISLQLKRVSIPQILDTIRNVYGYDFKRTSNNIEVIPAALQTRSYKINYVNVDRQGQSEIQVLAGGLNANSSGGPSTTTAGVSSTTSYGNSGQPIINSQVQVNSETNFWKELKLSVQTILGIVDQGTYTVSATTSNNGSLNFTDVPGVNPGSTLAIGTNGRSVVVSPTSGLLVVRAEPNELRRVEDYLKKAKLTINRQVIIEAKIMEVELNDSFQAGINWQILTGRSRFTEFGGQVVGRQLNLDDPYPFLNNKIADNPLAPPVFLNPGRANGVITPPFNPGFDVGAFGGVFAMTMNYKNLATFIELLSGQGKVHVLSNPRISTVNMQKAVIKVGRDQYFATNVSSTTTTGVGINGFQTPNVTLSPFFSGVALDVTPAIDDCNDVTLHIHPTISEVEDDTKSYLIAGQTTVIPTALSTVRETDNVVRAKSGQVIVIGGLMRDQTRVLKEGIPILKDLPIIGVAFRHTQEKVKKNELVILLRPIVVDDKAWTGILENTTDHFEELGKGC